MIKMDIVIRNSLFLFSARREEIFFKKREKEWKRRGVLGNPFYRICFHLVLGLNIPRPFDIFITFSPWRGSGSSRPVRREHRFVADPFVDRPVRRFKLEFRDRFVDQKIFHSTLGSIIVRYFSGNISWNLFKEYFLEHVFGKYVSGHIFSRYFLVQIFQPIFSKWNISR